MTAPPFVVASRSVIASDIPAYTIVGGNPARPLRQRFPDAVAYERIPADMRGRVFGAIKAGAWMAMPLGMLLGGILAGQFGVQSLIIALGIAYLTTTLSMAFIPALREMSRRSDAPVAAMAESHAGRPG